MRIQLRSTANHRYGGRSLVTGDLFEARPRDAKLLQVIGRAVEVLPAAAPNYRQPAATVAKAEEPADSPKTPPAVPPAQPIAPPDAEKPVIDKPDPTPEEQEQLSKKKREYKRRDIEGEK